MAENIKAIRNISETDQNYYNIFLSFSKSLNNISDIKHLCDVYSGKVSHEMTIKIMESMVYKKQNLSIGFEDFIDILELINKCSYRDDARKLVIEALKRTADLPQRNSLIRIFNSKPLRPHIVTMKEFRHTNKSSDEMVEKSCPHCGKNKIQDKDITYTVCGYDHNGFDWSGCQHDWCFRCGKKLCKSWHIDELFNSNNRYHSEKCCKNWAGKNNENYKENYCQCNKVYVDHKI